MRVVIIGSGIVGSSAAYECAKAGASVLVLDAGSIAGGTSAVTFAWTNATSKRPRPYFALNVAGMRAHLELGREFGATPWFHQTGSLEWRTSPEGLAAQRESVRQEQEWGYGVEWIDRRALAGMEPDIDATAAGDGPIAYYPEEGWVDAVVYCAWLLRAAKARWHAEVRAHARVTAVETENGRVKAVRTAAGERYPADAVVNCTGGWASEALGDAAGIPMVSTVGVLGVTPPVATTLRSQFHADDLDVRPDGAGRLMLHRVPVDEMLQEPRTLRVDGPEAAALLEPARAVLPALRGVGLEAIRTTIRPIPQDGFTCVGAMPDVAGYFLAVTHSGVTIAPHLGKVVADEVVRGRLHGEMESFRPARLLGT